MDDEAMVALRAAVEADPELEERFAQAATAADLLAVAADAGLDLAPSPSVDSDLSDRDLESVSGGEFNWNGTAPIFCNNPDTGYWCTRAC